MTRPVPGPYPQLDNFVHAYLNQDMDLWAETVEDAIALYAREAGPEEGSAMLDDLARFSSDHAGGLEEAFHDAYWFDFEPKDIGKTVPEFFAMIREALERTDGNTSV